MLKNCEIVHFGEILDQHEIHVSLELNLIERQTVLLAERGCQPEHDET